MALSNQLPLRAPVSSDILKDLKLVFSSKFSLSPTLGDLRLPRPPHGLLAQGAETPRPSVGAQRPLTQRRENMKPHWRPTDNPPSSLTDMQDK